MQEMEDEEESPRMAGVEEAEVEAQWDEEGGNGVDGILEFLWVHEWGY